MNLLLPNYYKNFKCIASACNDNCCIGWEIDIDDETNAFYQSQEGNFGKRLKENIIHTDCHSFRLFGKRCAFLNEQNLCDIILKLGENALCEICSEHPRYRSDFENLTEKGIGLCCEAAARLILNQQEKTTFETIEIPEKNSIFFSNTEQLLFSYFSRTRAILFSLLQNRNYKIKDRISFILSLGEEFQFCIDSGDFSDFDSIENDYFSDTFCQEMEQEFHSQDFFQNKKLYTTLLLHLQTLEVLDTKWIDLLKNLQSELPEILSQTTAFDHYYTKQQYEYEQLLVYFIYRYFMNGIYDGNAYSPILFSCISVMIIHLIDIFYWMKQNCHLSLEQQIDIVKMYSKEIEYSTDNLECMWNFLNEILDTL